jgi:Transposase
MISIGCDFHTRIQQIAMLDPTKGEIIERCLEHENDDVERFYAALPGPARVGIEATINARWFEKILDRYHHELWVGDAAEIRAAMVRKQKTDSRDAAHILDLLLTNRFPRIWMPSPADRDLRQLLRHRHKLVGYRTSVMNQLHGLAMSQRLCRKRKLWSQVGRRDLEALVLDPWASRRRQELLQLLDQAGRSINFSMDLGPPSDYASYPACEPAVWLRCFAQLPVQPHRQLPCESYFSHRTMATTKFQPLIESPQFWIRLGGRLSSLHQQIAHQGVALFADRAQALFALRCFLHWDSNRVTDDLFASLEAADGSHGQDKAECRYRIPMWLLTKARLLNPNGGRFCCPLYSIFNCRP